MITPRFLAPFLFLVCAPFVFGQPLDRAIETALGSLLETYRHLHANPEISYYEEKTGASVATHLRTLGLTVTQRVGNYGVPDKTCFGVVGVLKNGTGPTVMVRTDLDGLPLEEKTGLPYASTVRTKNETGEEVGAMHACGHDIHMTSFLGTARMLVQFKNLWQGTLVMIGQPAEERGAGAKAMLNDGLYARFPKPDFAIALHDNAALEAGKVGLTEGYALASVNSVDMTIRGVGGHGAYPHTTRDPVVIASEIVLALQTIVSREVSPLEPAVVTVGSIHGGTKHNIIPDEVHLQLTVRAYKEPVRKTILSAIKRIAEGIARSAGVPEDRLPMVKVDENEFTPATYNDPALTRRLATTFEAALGKDNVVAVDPVMGGEDFGRFGLNGQVPVSLFWLGAVDPQKVEESLAKGVPLPSLHSSRFAPVPEPTIRMGVKAMTSAVLELMKK